MTKQPEQEPVVVDRSDAVNLARNMLEVCNCKGITTYGVQVLCEAVMKMDAVLTSPQPAQQQEPVAQAGPPVAQVQAALNAQFELIEDYKALLAKTLPALIRLGDFVGNVDNGGASGLGRIDRCALILEVKNAIGK